MDCLRKREVIDRQYASVCAISWGRSEEDQLRLLTEREARIQTRRERTQSRVQAELERKRLRDQELMQSKGREFDGFVEELKQKALGKIREWQCNGAHIEKCESSRMRTVRSSGDILHV